MDERSAGMIIFREDEDERRYLLLHYPAGHWDYPKGHVEAGESLQQTALRELEEETGIKKEDVDVIPEFLDRIDYIYRKGRDLSHKEVLYMLGKTSKKKVTISREHQGFEWLSYDDAFDRLTFKNARNVLKKAEMYLQSTDNI